MNVKRILTGSFVLGALTLAGSAAMALTIDEAGPPAELPPADFKGLQFVDSRGCIYLRTGTAAYPNWVPRVTRDGEVVCGLVPTFAAAANAPVRGTVTPAPSPGPKTVRAPNTARVDLAIPPGYKPAWEDGRLNPLRGPRSY